MVKARQRDCRCAEYAGELTEKILEETRRYQEFKAPGAESFRECAVFIQNGIRMMDCEGKLVKTASAEGEEVDAEDTGEKGYNYRSERFANRLKKDKRISKLFSSRVHGDPATPVFRAYAGERIVFRTMMPADKPRNTGFAIHGSEMERAGKKRGFPRDSAAGRSQHWKHI